MVLDSGHRDGGGGTEGPGSPLRMLLPVCPRVPHRPLLGRAHFLLLVFLKVPLLLGMLGAVLWVHRPLRSSADRQRQSIYENQ